MPSRIFTMSYIRRRSTPESKVEANELSIQLEYVSRHLDL